MLLCPSGRAKFPSSFCGIMNAAVPAASSCTGGHGVPFEKNHTLPVGTGRRLTVLVTVATKTSVDVSTKLVAPGGVVAMDILVPTAPAPVPTATVTGAEVDVW